MLYTHVAGILLGAAIGSTGAWQIQSWRYSAKIAEIHERHNDELKASLLRAEANFKRVSNASVNAQKRSEAIQRDSRDAKSDLSRLRDAIPATVCTATSAPDTTSPLPKLFAECAVALEELAGKADQHSNDVRTLIEAWPK